MRRLRTVWKNCVITSKRYKREVVIRKKKKYTEDKEEMTDLPRLPPGVLLSSSKRNNGGTLKSIYFLGCDTGGERQTKNKQKERAQCTFHYKHIYTHTGYDDVISCTDM